jgi:prepilin-type processing-associated H-X9-DG protein
LLLCGYANNQKPIKCPFFGKGDFASGEQPGTIYSANSTGCGYDRATGETFGLFGIHESRVLVPSDMLALGDLGGSPDWWFWEGMAGFGWPGGVKSRHPNRQNNAVFCDGHVEMSDSRRIPIEKPAHGLTRFVPGAAQAKRWNNDNEPHPETWPHN